MSPFCKHFHKYRHHQWNSAIRWLVKKTEKWSSLSALLPTAPGLRSCCPGRSSAPERSHLPWLESRQHDTHVGHTAKPKVKFWAKGLPSWCNHAWGYNSWLNTCTAKNTRVSQPEMSCCIPPTSLSHIAFVNFGHLRYRRRCVVS